MRKILLIASLLMGVTSFAQHTTEEEYNYMNKGLQIQIESGLDMKKGYVLSEETQRSCADYECKRSISFSLLLRENDNSIAGIIVWCYYGNNKKIVLFGIPHRNNNLNYEELLAKIQQRSNYTYDYHLFISTLMVKLPELIADHYIKIKYPNLFK